MPVAGEIITRASADAAMPVLGKWHDDLERGAVAVMSPSPVKLTPITAESARRIFDELRAKIVWADDGACQYRAVLGTLLLHDRLGTRIQGSDDAVVAVIAHIESPRRGWGFHEAMAYDELLADGTSQRMVMDPLLAPEAPVPLDVWTQLTLDAPSRPLFIGDDLADLRRVVPGIANRRGWSDLAVRTWNNWDRVGERVPRFPDKFPASPPPDGIG